MLHLHGSISTFLCGLSGVLEVHAASQLVPAIDNSLKPLLVSEIKITY